MEVRTTIVVDVGEGGTVPARAHDGDAGYDLFASEDVCLEPMEYGLVPTGVRLEMPPGYEAQIRSRSGNALKKGLFVMNSPGTVDSGYRGEIGVILFNASRAGVVVKKGDKVAQMVFCALPQVDLVKGAVGRRTERGADGFGSTGTIGGNEGE